MEGHGIHHTPYATIGSSFYPKPPSSTINNYEFATPSSTKPRGRPLGSKNKPKAATAAAVMVPKEENVETLKPIIIEVPRGADVIEAVIQYARRNRVNISVLSASGAVTNVTLCHALSNNPAFTIHGPFTLMSLTGTYIINNNNNNNKSNNYYFGAYSSFPTSSTQPPCTFRISFCGAAGKTYVGIVGGQVFSNDRVLVVATTFKNHELHKTRSIDGAEY